MVLKFLIRRVCLFIAIFNFSIFAQQSANLDLFDKKDTRLNLSLPLNLCLQNHNLNILSTNGASDNILTLFIPLGGGKIEKINLARNSTIWISDLGGEIASDIIYSDGRIFVLTKVGQSADSRKDGVENRATDYILRSLNADTGLTVWQFPFSAAQPATLNSYQDKLYLMEQDGTIIAFGKNDAKKIFEKNIREEFSAPPVFFGNRIYISTLKNLIYVVSAADGKIILTTPTFQSPASALAAEDNHLYWGEKKGFVNLFDVQKKIRIRQLRYGGEITSVVPTPLGILVSSLDNFVYFISRGSGKSIWKRRLPGRTAGMPLLGGDFVIFVTSADSAVIIIDLKSGKIVNQINLADKGFILSNSLILGRLLAVFTNRGIFVYSNTSNPTCSEN